MSVVSIVIPKLLSAVNDIARARAGALAAINARHSSGMYHESAQACAVCGFMCASYNIRTRSSESMWMCSGCYAGMKMIRRPNICPVSMTISKVTNARSGIIDMMAQLRVLGSNMELSMSIPVTPCVCCTNAAAYVIAGGCINGVNVYVCNDCVLKVNTLIPQLRYRVALVYRVLVELCTRGLIIDLLPMLCTTMVCS